MHWHVINEAMELPAEIDVICTLQIVAVKLFESYMYSAASCQMEVKCESRWDWKVKNPETGQWVRVYVKQCEEVH